MQEQATCGSKQWFEKKKNFCATTPGQVFWVWRAATDKNTPLATSLGCSNYRPATSIVARSPTSSRSVIIVVVAAAVKTTT